MPFIDDLRNIQSGADTSITQTELIIKEILTRSGLTGLLSEDQYAHIYDIIATRNAVSAEISAAGLHEDVSLIGSLTEQICKIGMKASSAGRYYKLPRNWQWLGDFAIIGLPFNLFVSVKSYYARERLMVSGTGQGAAPVIGYGLFKDESEWNPSRVNQYKHKSFVAIYMPNNLYTRLSQKTGVGHPVTSVMNIYGRPFLRDIANFADDIKNIIKPDLIIKLEDF